MIIWDLRMLTFIDGKPLKTGLLLWGSTVSIFKPTSNGIAQFASIEQVQRAVQRRVLVHAKVPRLGTDLLVIAGVHFAGIVQDVFSFLLFACHEHLIIRRPSVKQNVDRVRIPVSDHLKVL